MIQSSFALELSSLYEFVQANTNKSFTVPLHIIENESSKCSPSELPMPYIAYYIHSIYKISNRYTRASIMRILCQLEINSETSIIEPYYFDKIIIQSLIDTSEQTNESDTEKISIFKLIGVLIQVKRILPQSLIRGMILLFSDKNCNRSYQQMILILFAKALLLVDNLTNVREISEILVNSLIQKPDDNFTSLLLYIFEKQSTRPIKKIIIDLVISSFSALVDTHANLFNISNILVKLLRTWPGLFCLSVDHDIFSDFFKVLTRSADFVIRIFSDILLVNGPENSVINPYTGFALYLLIQSGIIDRLSEISQNDEEIPKFLNAILPLTAAEFSTSKSVDFLPSPKFDFSPIASIVDKISFNLQNQQIPSSLANFTLPSDSNQWDWTTILSILTYILPSYEEESKTPAAINLYNRLFRYFNSFLTITSSPYNRVVINRCITTLIDLLLSRDQWGFDYLSTNEDFSKALISSFQLLYSQHSLIEHHHAWILIDTYCQLMSNPIGFRVLLRMSTFQILSTFIEKKDKTLKPKSAKRLLQSVSFAPRFDISAPFYRQFLDSNNIEIFNIALEELHEKAKVTPNFFINEKTGDSSSTCFRLVMLDFIRGLHQSKKTEQIQLALKHLGKMMMIYPDCIKAVALEKNFHEIIQIYSHEVLALIMQYPSPLAGAEIKYWMETGIYSYVNTYDEAVESTFDQKFSTSYTIVNVNGHALTPPHLFSQLGKYPEGFNMLKACVPELNKLIQSSHISKKRAAFFALGHLGSVGEGLPLEIVIDMVKTTLESTSYLLRGTMLVCLSMLKLDSILSDFLYHNGFQVFRFGSHTCIVPIDLQRLVVNTIPPEDDCVPFANPNNQFSEAVIKCISLVGNGNEAINKIRENKEQLMVVENVQFLFNAVTRLHFNKKSEIIMHTFLKNAQILEKPKDSIDMKLFAESMTRVYESCNLKGMIDEEMTFEKIQLQTIPANAIKTTKPNAPCPEVYLSDSEFLSVCGCNREKFYTMPLDNIARIRSRLLV